VRAVDARFTTSAAREEVRWALYRSWVGLRPVTPAYKGFQVPERAGQLTVVTPRFVRAAHRAALAVQVWTVNDERDMWRLLDWGVDGLISDRPDLAVRVRDAWAATRREGSQRDREIMEAREGFTGRSPDLPVNASNRSGVELLELLSSL